MKSKRTVAERLQEEITNIDGKLAIILLDAELRFPGLVLTHVWRKQSEQDNIYLDHSNPRVHARYRAAPWKSVHQCSPVRGADLRADDEAGAVAAWINSRWQYDPKRPRYSCAIIHDVGAGRHIHVQVHSLTVRRGKC